MTGGTATVSTQPRVSETQHSLYGPHGKRGVTERTTAPVEGPPHDLTGFQRDLLVLVASLEECNGLDIKDAYDAITGEDMNTGRLYPNLETLEETGLIDKEVVNRRTNAYRITPRGKRELLAYREWLRAALEPIDEDSD